MHGVTMNFIEMQLLFTNSLKRILNNRSQPRSTLLVFSVMWVHLTTHWSESCEI